MLLLNVCSAPILSHLWSPFISGQFSLARHWECVRKNFTENYNNDLAWLITLRAVKVRDSLRNWGYISSSWCASCSRAETIDHFFLNCWRAKSVWARFIPLLSPFLSFPFIPNCAFVFLFQFPRPQWRNFRLLLFVIKTILYGILKFRNKAVFHNGKESPNAIIRYLEHDIKKRISIDLVLPPFVTCGLIQL